MDDKCFEDQMNFFVSLRTEYIDESSLLAMAVDSRWINRHPYFVTEQSSHQLKCSVEDLELKTIVTGYFLIFCANEGMVKLGFPL